ncbi:MAG: hypothetical protein J6W86_02725 [Bacteroidales bacterium]|nr:hypothetical protein [Bacteroidales bacterium]
MSVVTVKLDNLLKNPFVLADKVLEKCHPLEYFQDYLKCGYYPFYQEGPATYQNRLEQIVNYTLEVELTELKLVDISGVRKLKKLVDIIAQEVPVGKARQVIS